MYKLRRPAINGLLITARRYRRARIVAEFIVATGRLFPVIPLNQISVFEFLHLTVISF